MGVLNKGSCDVLITLESSCSLELGGGVNVKGVLRWSLTGFLLDGFTIDVFFPGGMHGCESNKISYTIECTVDDMLKLIRYVGVYMHNYLTLCTGKNKLAAVTFKVAGGQGDMPSFSNDNSFTALIDRDSSVIPAGVFIRSEFLAMLRRLDVSIRQGVSF